MTKLFLVSARTDDRALMEFSHVRTLTVACDYIGRSTYAYRIAGNFGGKNTWRIALIIVFGGFYLAVG